MNCSHCQRQIQDDAQICPHCGASVTQDQNSGFQSPVAPVAIPNNLVWAILTTLFCCLPTGIYAIICAAKVDSLVAQGHFAEAKAASDKAKKWSIYGAIAGVVCMVLYFAVAVLFAAASSR